MSQDVPLTWNEALSGIAGSISVASWIFLLIPQLIENYQQSSSSAVSIIFILIWFLGDIANLAGALWAGLVPTVIVTAVYFCISDTILLIQCSYYRRKAQQQQLQQQQQQQKQFFASTDSTLDADHSSRTGDVSAVTAATATESSPLLPTRPKSNSVSVSDITDANLGLPGSRRRSSAGDPRRFSTNSRNILPSILETSNQRGDSSLTPRQAFLRATLKNIISILLIALVGTAGWALAWKAGAWRPTPSPTPSNPSSPGGDVGQADSAAPLGASILGYASAVLYLGARIPQILKNQREKSCDGLSLLFFLLSLMGNATYGAGILFHSIEKGYVLKNLPWLIGSLGTMVEDAVIFVQFSVFGEKEVGEDVPGEEDGEVLVD